VFSIADLGTSVPLTLTQNHILTVEADVEAICIEYVTEYCPASSTTKREAGVPFVIPSAKSSVNVSAYAVFVDAAV
jgi:hypothetical protein